MRPVQLVRRELDRDHVERMRIHHDLAHRHADVAGCDRPQPVGSQHRVEHLHRRRLAVGPGDAQPRSGVVRISQPPARARHRPRSGSSRRAAIPNSGAYGGQPGDVTTSWVASGMLWLDPGPSRTSTPRISSRVACSCIASSERSSTTVTCAPRCCKRIGSGEPRDPEAGNKTCSCPTARRAGAAAASQVRTPDSRLASVIASYSRHPFGVERSRDRSPRRCRR